MKKLILASLVALSCMSASAGEGNGGNGGNGGTSANAGSVSGAQAGSAAIAGGGTSIAAVMIDNRVPAETVATINSNQNLSGGTTSTLNTNSVVSGTQTINTNQNLSGGTTSTVNTNTSGTTTVKNVPAVVGAALTSSNDTCMGSSSVGGAGAGFGISIGSTWTDKNCVMLKNARELYNMGMPDAAFARLCMDDDNRDAIELTGRVCPQTKKAKEQQAAQQASAQ